MPEQIVEFKSRGFLSLTAHPAGCARLIERQAEQARSASATADRPLRALIVGGSAGYGLASRVALAWGRGARTLAVFLERPPSGKRTGSAGHYNTAALQRLAAAEGRYADSLNGDAFSDEVKAETAARIRQDLGQIDLLIYSLAAPRRTDPRSGRTYESVLRPIGQPFQGKTVNLDSGEVSLATVEPATDEQVAATVAVMGGDDWRRWIEALAAEGLLASGARTLAYSYIGPEVTWPIYRDGTIGAAKKDLEWTADELDRLLAQKLGGGAWVAVNKAVVTQASAAIPAVPLYMSLLFRVMERKGLDEGTLEQMQRLFELLPDDGPPPVDSNRLIRLDDREMRPDVQQEVAALWPRVTTENLAELADFAGWKRSFRQLFGFDVEGIDYGAPIETDLPIEASRPASYSA